MVDQVIDGEFEGAGLQLIGITDDDHFALFAVVRDESWQGSSLTD